MDRVARHRQQARFCVPWPDEVGTMTGRRRVEIDLLQAHLEPGESVELRLNGVVSGFTRWSGLGGIFGIVVALSVPRILNLPFLMGLVAIVAVMVVVFLGIYYGAGRPLAHRHDPPLGSPYLALVLTNRRVLLLDRALGADEPVLIESADVVDISTVRYGRAGPLVPQRLGFVIRGTARREYEFPRSERVTEFVDRFS